MTGSWNKFAEIRPLAEREQDILQVLLPGFALTKDNKRLLLDVSIGGDLPSIGDRGGRVRFYEVIKKIGKRGRAQLTRDLERFHKDGRLLSYRFDCSNYPLRYANGGVLPIIRLDAEEYFCCKRLTSPPSPA
jgi:hypothetical protein